MAQRENVHMHSTEMFHDRQLNRIRFSSLLAIDSSKRAAKAGRSKPVFYSRERAALNTNEGVSCNALYPNKMTLTSRHLELPELRERCGPAPDSVARERCSYKAAPNLGSPEDVIHTDDLLWPNDSEGGEKIALGSPRAGNEVLTDRERDGGV
ncbi:hypothetical protein Bbelb_338940 [Branchiostoma belcheri]|nr:hypothetical protein Bbelb_338940 [Branchiostoma belcheri]